VSIRFKKGDLVKQSHVRATTDAPKQDLERFKYIGHRYLIGAYILGLE